MVMISCGIVEKQAFDWYMSKHLETAWKHKNNIVPSSSHAINSIPTANRENTDTITNVEAMIAPSIMLCHFNIGVKFVTALLYEPHQASIPCMNKKVAAARMRILVATLSRLFNEDICSYYPTFILLLVYFVCAYILVVTLALLQRCTHMLIYRPSTTVRTIEGMEKVKIS